jgi:hypothetical protein
MPKRFSQAPHTFYVNFQKKGVDRFIENGVHEVRRNVMQWHKHKGAFVQSRVGDLQRFLPDDTLTIE